MKRFPLLKVLSWMLGLQLLSFSFRSLVNWLQEPHITAAEALSNWGIIPFLYPFVLSVAIYFFCLNSTYTALQQGSLSKRVQAVSITFILFLVYGLLSILLQSSDAHPAMIVLAVVLGSIFHCAIVFILAYITYHRDAKRKLSKKANAYTS